MKKQVFFLLPVLCTLFITFLHARIIHVPSDSSTIQGGINGAVNGDTVLVAPGTNYEHDVDFLGKAITVMSTDPADSAVVANTVVNGDSLGSVFIFRSGEDSTSILSGFTITGGLAEWGGGVFCSGASPTITNNMITGNSVYKEYHGGSWSGRGGGVYCGDSSSAIITYNTIVANMAEYSGGGIACGNGADVRITNNIIKENMVTDSGGGGIACISSAPRIINNLVVNNHVRMHGGGILFNNCPLGRIINTTIINNSSDYRTSGGFYCATSPVMTNCILWDNLPDEVDGNPVVTFSAVKGGWSGEGNTDENPIFIDPAGGLFYLAQDPCQPGITNPCVDEGDPSLPMVTGTTRTDGNQDSGRVDMGYHYPAGISGTVAPSARFTWTPLYPDPGVPVQFDASWSSDPDGGVISLYEWDWDNDGVYDESYAIPTVIHSWTEIDSYPVTLRVWDDEGDYDTQTESVRVYPNPIYVPDDYLTIQGAIDVAIDGDTIIVIPGTYYEHDLDFLGKAIMVRGTDPEDSSIVALTVVDASSLGRVFYFHSNEDSMSVLKGLTITGGLSNQGAGIYCYRASPKIENCIIRQNTATISGGGGISCFVSSAKIRNCSITGNLARDDFPGGGIACWHKSSSAESPVISNCRIRGNKALGGSGGGLYLDDNSTIVEHCTIIGDTALFGGGIETDSFKGEFKNCTIRENVATISVGGGVFCDTGTPLFTDCVVENNWAYGHGGGFISTFQVQY